MSDAWGALSDDSDAEHNAGRPNGWGGLSSESEQCSDVGCRSDVGSLANKDRDGWRCSSSGAGSEVMSDEPPPAAPLEVAPIAEASEQAAKQDDDNDV